MYFAKLDSIRKALQKMINNFGTKICNINNNNSRKIEKKTNNKNTLDT